MSVTGNVTAAGASSGRWFYMLFGIGIGVLFLYLTIRNVDLGEAMATIAAVDPIWVLPVAIVYLLNLALRCRRWQLLFPDNDRPSLRYATDAYMIGRLANNFMPGKLGEIIRAAVLGRFLPEVGITGALATVVVEKILDALIIIALLGLALLVAPVPEWVGRTGLVMIIVFPSALVALVFLDRAQHRFKTGKEPAKGALLRSRLAHSVRGALHRFSTGLYAIRTAQHFTMVSAMTLSIWVLEAIVLYICFQAFELSAPPAAALVTLVFLCAGSMLPSAPGFIGSYQLFIVSALQLYNIPETSAFAMAVFINVFIIVLTTALGMMAIMMDGGMINLRQLMATARSSS
ncbi:MAG: hypothetical protein ACI9NT_001136 [Bacteroidia bacterium]